MEYEALLRRAEDLQGRCERQNMLTSTPFLRPAEQAAVLAWARTRAGCRMVLRGGHAECERKAAFFLPDYLDEENLDLEEEISAVALRAYYGEPGHRDYLGAILAMGLRREWIGDIWIQGQDALVFCLPSVVINSSAWAQCDVIYTTFLVICLYYLLKGRDSLALIMLGISFSFKIQSIFLLPLIGILIMKRKVRWRTLLWIPAVYVMSIIPATIAGGDFKRLLTVYLFQSGQYPQLTLSLSNIWALWEGMEDAELGSAGIFFAGAVVIIMMYYYITDKKLTITKSTVIGMAMMSSFIVPFVLPHMHERYMYLTEIMFVLFAFYYKKRAWLIATSQYCTVQCLSRFLYGHDSMDMRWLTLIQIVNIAFVFYTLREEIASPADKKVIKMLFEKKAEKKLMESLEEERKAARALKAELTEPTESAPIDEIPSEVSVSNETEV